MEINGQYPGGVPENTNKILPELCYQRIVKELDQLRVVSESYTLVECVSGLHEGYFICWDNVTGKVMVMGKDDDWVKRRINEILFARQYGAQTDVQQDDLEV